MTSVCHFYSFLARLFEIFQIVELLLSPIRRRWRRRPINVNPNLHPHTAKLHQGIALVPCTLLYYHCPTAQTRAGNSVKHFDWFMALEKLRKFMLKFALTQIYTLTQPNSIKIQPWYLAHFFTIIIPLHRQEQVTVLSILTDLWPLKYLENSC